VSSLAFVAGNTASKPKFWKPIVLGRALDPPGQDRQRLSATIGVEAPPIRRAPRLPELRDQPRIEHADVESMECAVSSASLAGAREGEDEFAIANRVQCAAQSCARRRLAGILASARRPRGSACWRGAASAISHRVGARLL
jgi:hypothetical protein